MTINGREYSLSPRRAGDVIALAGSIAGKEIDNTINVLIVAQGLCDALKATGKRLGFIRSFMYRRFARAGAGVWLTDQLSVAEIFTAWEELNEIEGGSKKKVLTAGSEPETM